jgi:hypothetical protein
MRRIWTPDRIAQPISWRAEPGWFGTRYFARFTDGSWRRVSLAQIVANAGSM